MGSPIRILVVDDEPLVRAALRRYLAALGHEIHEAETGERALQILAREIPDVVLLDIVMPGMSGYEVNSRMFADEKLRKIPVVIVSALQVEEVRRGAFVVQDQLAGARCIMSKPLDMKELEKVLEYLDPGTET